MKLALPKGRLLKKTAELLQSAGFGLEEYDDRSRSYRPRSTRFSSLFCKVFQEKHIPIQVTIGNYDLGICGLDWVEELQAKYPSDDLVTVGDLGYGASDLYVSTSKRTGVRSLAEVSGRFERLRIVSEYPNLAERFALKHRLRRFSILPVWGATEAYPPESAELAIVSDSSVACLTDYDLVPLARVLSSSAVLVANRSSLAKGDMSRLLGRLKLSEVRNGGEQLLSTAKRIRVTPEAGDGGAIRLALPDGHQQRHAVQFLQRAGIAVNDYCSPLKTRRPRIGIDDVTAKVIRPQDMPLQVANENFDLALTGEDWLRDHLSRFPSSPVRRIADLRFGRVKIVAVVSESLPIEDVEQLRQQMGGILPMVRVASEYVNIADKYARDNHLGHYKVIPTWGASEAFLPEDADLLIENTETGRTLKKHKLRVIDTLFESTACLISNTGALSDRSKRRRMQHIIELFERTARQG